MKDLLVIGFCIAAGFFLLKFFIVITAQLLLLSMNQWEERQKRKLREQMELRNARTIKRREKY